VKTSRKGSGLAVLIAAGLGLTAALGLPASASATAQNYCKGKATKGATAGASYEFWCAEPITGYSLISSKELSGYEVSNQVFDHGTVISDESLACEGDIPGQGVNCNGTYRGQAHVVQGALTTTDGACQGEPLRLQLVVTWAQPDYTKKTVAETVSGPFNFGAIGGCPPRAKSLRAGKKHKKKGGAGKDKQP
jgi:hypothetical protein